MDCSYILLWLCTPGTCIIFLCTYFVYQQINDSNIIISVLRTCSVLKCTILEALQMYPEITFTDEKGKDATETANKYFIMHGEIKVSTDKLSQLRYA